MQIIFKHHQDCLDYWPRVHQTLKDVFTWACTYLAERKNVYAVRVTAVFYEGSSGVHQAFRAADFRVYREGGFDKLTTMQEISPVEYRGLEHLINSVWEYGDGKHNVAFVHDAGTGIHVHLQVRDETRKRQQ